MEDSGAEVPGRRRLKSQHEFLKDVLELLRRSGIEHMIVGSIASSFHGRPRATQDVDVVVEGDPKRVAELVRLCAERGYYADSVDAEDAVRQRSLFNVIDPASGHKLDLIIKKARPFSEEEFARRRAATLLDVEASIATAEDVILAKLELGAGVQIRGSVSGRPRHSAGPGGFPGRRVPASLGRALGCRGGCGPAASGAGEPIEAGQGENPGGSR